jgi:hypothetical protein
MNRLTCFALAIVFSALASPAAETPVAPEAMVLRQIQTEPSMSRDGNLDDWAGYALPAQFALFVPKCGGVVPDGLSTKVYGGFGKDAVFFAVECLDANPEKIVAGMHFRDTPFGREDYVSLILDPTGKGHYGYAFRVNAEGVQWDGRVINGQGIDDAYDLLWESSAARTRKGWVVKFRIPYKSLGEVSGQWRVRFARAWPRELGYAVTWPLQGEKPSNWLGYAGILSGAQVSGESANCMAIVSGTGARSYDAATGTTTDRNLGLDFRWRSGNGTRADLTLHPDFSTVEMDVNPLAVNTFYKVELPEKRPFFQEGMSTLLDGQSGQISTRSILAPLWGMKGSFSSHGIGGAVLVDEDTGGGNAMATDGASTAGLRTRDVAAALAYAPSGTENMNGRFGFAMTNRSVVSSPDGWGSRTVGAQGMLNVGSALTFKGTGILSDWKLPLWAGDPGTAHSGTYYATSLDYHGEHWIGEYARSASSPDLRLDMGFLNIIGVRQESGYLGYVWKFDKSPLSYANVRVIAYQLKNYDDSPFYKMEQVAFDTAWRGQVEVSGSYLGNGHVWFGGNQFELKQGTVDVVVGTVPGQLFSFSHTFGLDADYTLGRQAHTAQWTGGFAGTIGPVTYNLQPSLVRLRDVVTNLETLRAERLYAKLEWVLPIKDFFIRIERQTVRTDRLSDPADTSSLESGRSASWNLLGSWRPNLFSGVYLGYAQVRASGFIPNTGFIPNRQVYDFLQNKGLYFKASYGFQF